MKEELSSAKVQREILEILYHRESLEAGEILGLLTAETYEKFSSSIDFHFDVLCMHGLIERKPIGSIKTIYNITGEGRQFYETLPKDRTPESVARFLAKIITPYSKKPGVSEEEVYNSLLGLLSR